MTYLVFSAAGGPTGGLAAGAPAGRRRALGAAAGRHLPQLVTGLPAAGLGNRGTLVGGAVAAGDEAERVGLDDAAGGTADGAARERGMALTVSARPAVGRARRPWAAVPLALWFALPLVPLLLWAAARPRVALGRGSGPRRGDQVRVVVDAAFVSAADPRPRHAARPTARSPRMPAGAAAQVHRSALTRPSRGQPMPVTRPVGRYGVGLPSAPWAPTT